MNFDDIMKGFVDAQIAANKRGDFSPDAGVEYLNGVNVALTQKISAPDVKLPFRPQRDWTPRTPATMVMENRDTDTSYTDQDKEEYTASKVSAMKEECHD